MTGGGKKAKKKRYPRKLKEVEKGEVEKRGWVSWGRPNRRTGKKRRC